MASRGLARAFSVIALLCLSCAPSFRTPAIRSRFHQSCGAACAAPIQPSTGEIIPAVVRFSRTVETVIQAGEALQGFVTVSKFLDEAERKVVETIVVECVKEANTMIDEELFGKDRTLPDSECDKQAVTRNPSNSTWAQYLGDRKHSVALTCIQTRLARRFPDHFSIEPRLRKDSLTQEVLLTDWRKGSLKPDVVLHFLRNVTRIQCIYELKFPCGYEIANPWNSYVDAQMKLYKGLGGECPPVLVSPQWGLQYGR